MPNLLTDTEDYRLAPETEVAFRNVFAAIAAVQVAIDRLQAVIDGWGNRDRRWK